MPEGLQQAEALTTKRDVLVPVLLESGCWNREFARFNG